MLRRLPYARGPTWLWVLACSLIMAGLAYLRLGVFPDRFVPLNYGLPLLLCLWRRDLRLLWGMTAAMLAILGNKLAMLLSTDPEGAGLHLLFGSMQFASILLLAGVVHLVILLARRLDEASVALAQTNVELEASNEEIAAREEEVSQQNEELRSLAGELEQQAEALAAQTEELQQVNEQLVARERTLNELVALSATGASEEEVLGRLGRTVMGLFAPRAVGAAVLEQRGQEMLVRPIAGVAQGEQRLDGARTVAGTILERGRPGYVADTALRPDLALPELEGGAPVRSVLAAPVRENGSSHAVLEVYASEPGEWSDLKLRLVQWCAEQGGLLWTTVRMRQDLARLVDSERDARSEAERANREKDEFIATLAHEMRTPIGAIAGWASLLRMSVAKPEQFDKALEVIERNAHHQAQLISDLMDINSARVGKLHIESRPVDLPDVIEAALDVVRPAAQDREIQLESRIGALPGVVMGDAARLQQVVWNLLTNAVKFTPRGGAVRVELSQAGEDACVRVVDTGKGIEADVLPFLFERYRQGELSATGKQAGLGLGLAIVKHLVELHGGTARIESEGPERGTECTVTLPMSVGQVSEGAGEGSASPTTSIETRPLQGLSILVVDDDPDTLEVVSRMLESHGASVAAARSARVALERLDAEPVHVIISDIGMPELDGYAFIHRVREHPDERIRRLPAIAMTAFARPQDRTRALVAGYQFHLAKPVRMDALVAAVTEVCGTIGVHTDGD